MMIIYKKNNNKKSICIKYRWLRKIMRVFIISFYLHLFLLKPSLKRERPHTQSGLEFRVIWKHGQSFKKPNSFRSVQSFSSLHQNSYWQLKWRKAKQKNFNLFIPSSLCSPLILSQSFVPLQAPYTLSLL